MAPWTKSRGRWAPAGLILAFLFAARGDAQQQEEPGPAVGQQPPPVFRTGIDFVRVDVIVTDSKTGKPVEDLKQGDFQVTEEKRPKRVETLKLIELEGGAVPAPGGPPQEIRSDDVEELEAAREDVRLFAIFLDDYHTRA